MRIYINGCRCNTLHNTNFWGTIEAKKFAKSTSKEHREWGSLLHFTPFQKKELVFWPIYRVSVIETVFFVSCHSNLHVNERGGMTGGAVHMNDSEKARNWHQNVLIHHLLGAWRIDFAVSHTPKPVMFFDVLKAAVPLDVHVRPQQGLCLLWFRCVSCARTQENIFFHGHAQVACCGVTHLASWTCRCSAPSSS